MGVAVTADMGHEVVKGSHVTYTSSYKQKLIIENVCDQFIW